MKKLIVLSLVASYALSAAPNAGDVSRDVKITQPPKIQKELIKIPTREYKVPMKALEGKKILVNKIIVENDGNIEPSVLENLVKSSLNKKLTLGQLNEMAGVITKYYRDSGYFVAKAYIPEQTIKKGIVKVVVVTGQYDKFTIKNKSLVTKKDIQGFMDELTSGQAVSTYSLERQLLLINDLSGAIVTNAEIFPGEKVGTSSFTITADKTDKYYSYANLDNYGGKYTGRHRLSVFGMVNSVTKRGDSLSANAMITEESLLKNVGLNYLSPIGYKGIKVGLNLGYTEYKLGEDYTYLNASGETKIISATVSYPYIKTRSHTLESSLTYNYKDLSDTSLTNKTDKSINSVDISLSDDRKVYLKGKAGKLKTSLTFTAGDLSLDSTYAKAQDAAGLDSEGKYEKLGYSISYAQTINQSISLSASLRGQESLSKNLDSSEDFALGGPSAVRAYNSGEVSGDSGYLASIETFYTLPALKEIQNHKASLFLDTGRVTINKKDFNADKNSRTLSAVGVGYYVNYKKLNVAATFATGFGSEKEVTAESGASANKFYASFNYSF